jgi:hypothetical protein
MNTGLWNVGSGSALNLGGTWTNGGTFTATNGSVGLGGAFVLGNLGNFDALGSALSLTGTLDNTNNTLVVDGAVGSWVLSGGTVLGGTVMTTNGGTLTVLSGTLDGVTVNGVLDLGSSFWGANLTVLGGLVLNGTALVGSQGGGSPGYGSSISFSGSQVLSGVGSVVFGVPPQNYANALEQSSSGATLVIGPGITVRGQSGVIGAGAANVSVVNQGTISADVNRGTITVAGSSFSNAGQLVESGSGGSISITASTVSSGLIESDHGTITFSGSFTQNVGTLSFGLSSLSDFGQITLAGSASVGGTLAAQTQDGYLPSVGDSFAVLDFATNTVAFTNLNLPNTGVWQTKYNQGLLTLVVTGIPPLAVTVSPTNQIVAVGSTVTLQATAGGPGPLEYQWESNGVALAGATNAELVLSNAPISASGAYTVVVSNPNASVPSAPADVLVLARPGISVQPQSQTNTMGTAVTFQVTAAGSAPLSYQWSFDGAALPGATNASLTLTNVTRVAAGSYSVVVSNAVGSVTSAPLAALSIATGVACPGTPPGMVAWWRGEWNTADYGGTNDAVFEGAVGYGPGEVGEAFLFDGETSYLQVPNSPLWALGTNDFSIEFWANFAQLYGSLPGGDGSVGFIGQDEGPGARNKWFFGFGGQELYFYFNAPALGPHLVAPAAVSIVSNQWYHLAVTRESGVFRIYNNGVQVSVETNSLAVPLVSAPLTIGQVDGFYMSGLLDEVSVYNRALGAGEIQAIYQAGSQGKCGLESVPAIRLQAQLGPGGKVTILITGGQPGATLTLEATEDFKQWTTLGSLLESQQTQTFTDPTPVLPPARYYRVIETINP